VGVGPGRPQDPQQGPQEPQVWQSGPGHTKSIMVKGNEGRAMQGIHSPLHFSHQFRQGGPRGWDPWCAPQGGQKNGKKGLEIQVLMSSSAYRFNCGRCGFGSNDFRGMKTHEGSCLKKHPRGPRDGEEGPAGAGLVARVRILEENLAFLASCVPGAVLPHPYPA